MPEALLIWRFTDGKRGHENQTRGLINALSRITPVEEVTIPQSATKGNPLNCLLKRFPAGRGLPRPHLLVGAGRQTHWPLLAAKRNTGAIAVLLMRPPFWLQNHLDLCFIPGHDQVKAANSVATRGALTAVVPGGDHLPGRGVILIGGPSSHHLWDGDDIVESVREIASWTVSSIKWKLTTSRRTPQETTTALLSLAFTNLQVFPVEKTDSNWVPGELAASEFAWVTEDSVSMVYEAVTSGAATGVLPVPRRRTQSRVIRGLDQLVSDGFVSRFDYSFPSLDPSAGNIQLDEASRCAEIILGRFFPHLLPHPT